MTLSLSGAAKCFRKFVSRKVPLVAAKQEEMEGLSIQENITKYNGRKEQYDPTDEEAKSALIDNNQDIAQRLTVELTALPNESSCIPITPQVI